MAIGDGLCDPETMTDYGDFLFGIGLIDEDDRDYFSKVAKLQVDYIKQQKWFQAFQVSISPITTFNVVFFLEWEDLFFDLSRFINWKIKCIGTAIYMET